MVKQFEKEENKYWVNGKPYIVNGDDIKPLAGLPDEKEIEELRKHLRK